jgi:hypothetical protein
MLVPAVPKTVEPYRGEFTGTLSTYTSQDRKRYVFAQPHPRIVSGVRYMVVIEGTRIKLLPIIL